MICKDDDSGVDVFKLKKSMLSRKFMQKTAPSTPSPGTPTPSQASPRYDDEYIRQLKASTPQSRSSVSMYNESSESGVTVNAEDVARLNITAPDDDMGTVIPSESSIKAAKERRGRLKGNGGSEDFISLSVARHTEIDDGPHPESRLVREEDELGEGDDEFADYTSAQERIAIGKKSRKVEAKKNRATMREMIEDA
jgi:GC-rich sequence DNA-binding factor